MKITRIDRMAAYPIVGGPAAFTDGGKAWVESAHDQRGRLNCAVAAQRVQTMIAITDVPDTGSALSLVRRT